MRFAIVASANDLAGITIRNSLQKAGFAPTTEIFDSFPVLQWKDIKLYTINTNPLFFELCDSLSADFLIFATKHSSKAGVPSLCMHPVGNWGNAEFGGKEKELVIAPAHYLKMALQLLEKKNTIGYEVFQEATHHGPASTKPILFMEIGSSESQYENNDAGNIIAETIMELVLSEPMRLYAPVKSAVGIGGLHHTANFKKIQIESDVAIGHVCPKYALDSLKKDILLQAIDKTYPKAELVILDWKGLGTEKERIKKIVEEVKNERGISVMRTQEF